MSRILIENGRVIDPSQKFDRVTNLLVDNGRIAAYDAVGTGNERVIPADGKIVSPGLIDLHVQLREPGREEDETIESGTAAAVAGGFTSIVCLPNTEPPIDTQAGVEFIRQKAARAGNCHVLVAGCVSKDRAGKELAEIGSLVEAGAVAFTDAPRSIQNAELMRRAFEYCLMFDKPILNHPEDLELSHDGVMHEGTISMLLGLEGLPVEAEDVMTSRDLRLAEATHGRLHLLNISSHSSVDLIRRVKSRGVGVTAGVCMYNLVLTDDSLRTFDSNYKVESPAAVAGARGSLPAGPERRHHRRDLQRSRPAGLGKEDAGVGSSAVRHGRIGDLAGPGDHQAHQARTSGLDDRVGKADDQPGPRAGHPQRNAGHRGGSRRDHYRPGRHLDGRSETIPLQESEHAVRRLDPARPSRPGAGRRPTTSVTRRQQDEFLSDAAPPAPELPGDADHGVSGDRRHWQIASGPPPRPRGAT